MTEQTPWHERAVLIEDERRFHRLLILHGLTQSWTEALVETGNLIERMPKITLTQNLWLLEKARVDEISLRLDQLVGATSVNEYLDDLEETIFIIQMSTLENAFSQTQDRGLLTNRFETASWNHGKKTAESEWKGMLNPTLASAFDAFLESVPHERHEYVLMRSAAHELRFIWKKSPYQKPALKLSPEIETFTHLHEEWARGFFYGLSRNFGLKSQHTRFQEETWIEFTLSPFHL